MKMAASKLSYEEKGNINLRKREPNDFDNFDSEKYMFGNYGYGKNSVKLLHVLREGPVHTIREYEVDTHLKLSTTDDYVDGNNRNIIATDSQKNTVYVLAKKFGIKTPEEFGLLICTHFLYTYKHVNEVEVIIEQYPWERLQIDNRPHNHAFIFNPSSTRYASVRQKRHDSPKITSGINNLRVLKTTQSAFTDFIQDGYRTLPDDNDRIFSTIVKANWSYGTANGVDFDLAWHSVKDYILEKFAGPPDVGIFSPSVQNTLYLAEKTILNKIPQIDRVEMSMPNKHYNPVDLSKFPQSVIENSDNKEVYQPVDKPAGIIYAELLKKNTNSKL